MAASLTAADDPGVKIAALRAALAEMGAVAVAFSGGVDSSFLLRMAVDTLGRHRVLALHMDSVLQHHYERERAVQVASGLGASYRAIRLDPLSWPDFVDNHVTRCYHCKKKIYGIFQEILRTEMADAVLLDGTNTDDLSEDRPGHRAILEVAVATPLAAVGLTKAEIRTASRALGLSTWNQPGSSCLATRIPHGRAVTGPRLELVRLAEEFLFSRGYAGCRCRLPADDTVMIELPAADLSVLVSIANRAECLAFFRKKSITQVFLDLTGRPML